MCISIWELTQLSVRLWYAKPPVSFNTQVRLAADAQNPQNSCRASWWTDPPLLCPSCINLSGDLGPPVTTPSHTHSQYSTTQRSSAWIMYNQTVGSEIMSRSLREPGETDTRALWGLYRAGPSLTFYFITLHQMSKVQGDELWVIPLALLLQCHHIKRQEHVVSPMWLCVCVCESDFAEGWRTKHAHSTERWSLFNLDALALLRARETSPCNHPLCFF